MSEIKTLVYCELEATGLKNSGRPRISELSLVAVNIEDVLELHSKIKIRLLESTHHIDSILPRVMNKLSVCVYPMSVIRPEVTDITGLDNYNLSGQSTFDKSTGELINNFLAHLPGPLCLFAHNGDRYDFPLLKAELDKAKTTLLTTTLCVDSYVGIQEIFKRGDFGAQHQNDATMRSKKRLNLNNIGNPRSYSLINLHKHLLGCYPTQSHGAEADCLTLIRTTAVLGNTWIEWAQENCYQFSRCAKMWSFRAL